MARQAVIKDQSQGENDTRSPHERFTALASKVLSVPKTEIDKREAQWKTDKE